MSEYLITKRYNIFMRCSDSVMVKENVIVAAELIPG